MIDVAIGANPEHLEPPVLVGLGLDFRHVATGEVRAEGVRASRAVLRLVLHVAVGIDHEQVQRAIAGPGEIDLGHVAAEVGPSVPRSAGRGLPPAVDGAVARDRRDLEPAVLVAREVEVADAGAAEHGERAERAARGGLLVDVERAVGVEAEQREAPVLVEAVPESVAPDKFKYAGIYFKEDDGRRPFVR
jgi:hypothetical protein